MRAARLWAGPGQTFAAEGLRLDHRPDLVAINIEIADAHAIAYEIRRGIDAAVQAKRQSVGGGIDGVANRVQAIACKPDDVKNEAGNLILEYAHRFDGGDVPRKEPAVVQGG